MPIPLNDSTWRALARETGMAGRLVNSDLTSLRRANSAVDSVYYEGFFGVTIGLERICKLAIVVSEFVKRGVFPTDRELKNKYGHDLKGLVREVQTRITAGQLSTDWPIVEDDETNAIVDFLTDFAKFNRYYNLSFLGGAGPAAEPISTWVDLVLKFHPKVNYSAAEARNLAEIELLDALIGDAFMIIHADEHGNPIENLRSGAVHGIATEHVRRQGTMMCAHLARSLASALSSLGYARTAAGDSFPVFSEFFGILLTKMTI